MFDDYFSGGLGGLGKTAGNVAADPYFLAGIQMLGNNTPKIGAIPNTFDHVPQVLMSATAQQRKADEDARQIAEKKRSEEALAQSLMASGYSETDARRFAPSMPGIGLVQDYRQKQADKAEADSFFARPPQPAAPASQQQAPQPSPQMRQTEAADPLATAATKFDDFGKTAYNGGQFKTVGEMAASTGNKTQEANFLRAAQAQGLNPDSQLTSEILSNPATAQPLAQALGVGADLSPEQFQQAHYDAFQASKARQAATAARAAAPPQRGPAQSMGAAPPQQQAPQPAPQQRVQAQPAAPPQQQAPAPQQLNQTEQAMAAREQNRIAELKAVIAQNERYMGSKNPEVKAAATSRVAEARAELAKEPKFQAIGKNEATGETQYGFVKGGDVIPYSPPKSAKDSGPVDERGLYPGETTEERLQSVPADDRSFIQQMIDGRVAPPSSFAMKTPYWQNKMLQASRVDPELDYTKWGARAATRKDFDSGKTAQNLVSMGQTYGHFGKLTDAIDKLDNSDFPLANKARNAALSATGSDKASNVMTAAKAVSSEVARVFKGVGVIGEKEAKEWADTLSPDMSPEQLRGSVRTLLDLIDSRVQEQGARWDSQFPNEPRNLYSKSAEKALERVREWSEKGAAGTEPKLPRGVKSIQVVQ